MTKHPRLPRTEGVPGTQDFPCENGDNPRPTRMGWSSNERESREGRKKKGLCDGRSCQPPECRPDLGQSWAVLAFPWLGRMGLFVSPGEPVLRIQEDLYLINESWEGGGGERNHPPLQSGRLGSVQKGSKGRSPSH